MTIYCHSVDRQEFKGKFDTIELAKLDCVLSNKLEVGTIYHIGEVVSYEPRDFIGVMDLIEKMHAQAVDEVGEESVGLWPDVTPSKYHELRELLADFFQKNYPVDFSGVANVKSFIAGE